MKKYDVVIIGAGTAGLSARKQVAKKTNNYIVVDGGTLGTTCARVGCMPSKVFIQVANDFHRRHSFEKEGISGAIELQVDTKNVMVHVRKLRDRFVKGVMKSLDSWEDEKLIRKFARFTGKNTMSLGEEEIKFEKAIIATGSSPKIPDPWKQHQNFFINTNDFFELESLPSKMAVIGLGVIGMELGQALHRLGVDVICIGKKNVSGISDPQLNEYAIEKFGEEMNIDMSGINIMDGHGDQLKITTNEGEYCVDKVLISVGRTPNVKDIGIDKLTDKLNNKGVPDFNKKTFQLTDAPHVFIAGDVNDISPILHESADEGTVAGFYAVSGTEECFERRVPMGVTFCSPNIAYAGKRYSQLKDEGIDFEIGEARFEGQGRAIVMLKEKGLLRVYGSKKDNKLLGAELMAPGGEHMAHLLAWAIGCDMTIQEVLSKPFYHPVLEEGLRSALRDLFKKLELDDGSLELARCAELDLIDC